MFAPLLFHSLIPALITYYKLVPRNSLPPSPTQFYTAARLSTYYDTFHKIFVSGPQRHAGQALSLHVHGFLLMPECAPVNFGKKVQTSVGTYEGKKYQGLVARQQLPKECLAPAKYFVCVITSNVAGLHR